MDGADDLKEVTLQHSNGVLLFYTSITSPPKFVVLLVLDWSLELLNQALAYKIEKQQIVSTDHSFKTNL